MLSKVVNFSLNFSTKMQGGELLRHVYNKFDTILFIRKMREKES